MGKSGEIECLRGIINIGEPMAVPIIDELKDLIDEKTTVIDCAPGSSCNVVKALMDSDYAVLVTEPTEFGLHDLKIAVELARKMNISFGVIINRADEDQNLIVDYCENEDISIVGIIPFDKKAAVLYSKGKLLVEDERYLKLFEGIVSKILEVIPCS